MHINSPNNDLLYIGFSAYNEEKNLSSLFSRLGALNLKQIIVYNDGSTDDTFLRLQELSSQFPLAIIHSDINRGLGVGLQEIIDYASAHLPDDALLVLMDADDTHDPLCIGLMQQEVADGYDVIITSRYAKGAVVYGVPLLRILLSKACSYFWRAVLAIPNIKDYSSGYRAYRVAVLKKAWSSFGKEKFITRSGFECQIEILARLKEFSRMTEVPIHLDYRRKASPSAMRIIKTIRGHLSLAYMLLRG